MEIINALIIFLIGVVVGISIVIAKNRFSDNHPQVKDQLAQCQQEQAMLRQEFQDQIASAKSLANQLNEMANTVNAQVAEAETLVVKADAGPAFPFFSQEATEFLKKTPQQPRKKSQMENQPLDYSEAASGVFKGVTPSPEIEKQN